MREIRNWYPLLEGEGLVASDFGPAKKPGTLTENIIWLPKGLTIAASESRIVSAAAATFNAAEGSIELLFKPKWNYTDGAEHHFFDTYEGNNLRFNLAKWADNLTYLRTGNISRGSFTYEWAADTLYHLVLNYGTNKLYINKTLVHDYTDGGLGDGADNLYIGDRYAGANWSLDADLFYFIVRDLPLTQDEINDFYNFFTKQYE